MGVGYLNRFKDLSDWTYIGHPGAPYPREKFGLYRGIRGRVARLHEFVKELQAKL